MNKCVLVLAVGALASVAAADTPIPALSGTLDLVGRPNAIQNGGEFRFVSQGGDLFDRIGLGAGEVLDSFCIELNEPVSVGTTYEARVNTAAFGGGVNTSGTGFNGTGDPIDSRTAFLFTKFSNGTLDNYEYGEGGESGGGLGGDLNRSQTARGLQLALWVIEQEMANVSSQAGTAAERALAQAYIDMADAAILSGGEWFGMGMGSVRAINMGANGENQDMLVIVPLPQAGGLAALGLAGIAIRRRRRSI